MGRLFGNRGYSVGVVALNRSFSGDKHHLKIRRMQVFGVQLQELDRDVRANFPHKVGNLNPRGLVNPQKKHLASQSLSWRKAIKQTLRHSHDVSFSKRWATNFFHVFSPCTYLQPLKAPRSILATKISFARKKPSANGWLGLGCDDLHRGGSRGRRRREELGDVRADEDGKFTRPLDTSPDNGARVLAVLLHDVRFVFTTDEHLAPSLGMCELELIQLVRALLDEVIRTGRSAPQHDGMRIRIGSGGIGKEQHYWTFLHLLFSKKRTFVLPTIGSTKRDITTDLQLWQVTKLHLIRSFDSKYP